MDLVDDIVATGGSATDDASGVSWPFAEDAFFEQMTQAAAFDADGLQAPDYAVETLEQAQARIGDRLADIDDGLLASGPRLPFPPLADAPAIPADDPFLARPAVDDLLVSLEDDDFVLGRDTPLIQPGEHGMEPFQTADVRAPAFLEQPSLPVDETLGGPAQTLHLWVQDDWLF